MILFIQFSCRWPSNAPHHLSYSIGSFNLCSELCSQRRNAENLFNSIRGNKSTHFLTPIFSDRFSQHSASFFASILFLVFVLFISYALIFKWSWKYIFIRRIRNFFIYKSPPISAHSFLFLFSNQNYKYNYDNHDRNSSFRNQNDKRVRFPNSNDFYNRPQSTPKAKFNLNSTYFDILCTPPQKIL